MLTLNKPLKLNTSILKKFVLGYVGIFFLANNINPWKRLVYSTTVYSFFTWPCKFKSCTKILHDGFFNILSIILQNKIFYNFRLLSFILQEVMPFL